MSAAALEPEELDAIRAAIQKADPTPAPRAGDPEASPIAIIADSRAAERARPAGLKVAGRWAASAERRLAGLIGTRLAMNVAGVDTVDGATLKADVADGWLHRVQAGAETGAVIVTGSLIEAVVARMLGDTSAGPTADRPPSPVARRLFAQAGLALIAGLTEAWRDELGGTLAPIGPGDAWRHELGDDDLVVVVTLTTTVPTGTIRLAGRPEMLAGALAHADRAAAPVAPVGEILGGVPAEVVVELGVARLTMAELLALEPGAVITIDRLVDDPVPVSVAGIVKAHGKPIVDRGAIAVEIVDVPHRTTPGDAR